MIFHIYHFVGGVKFRVLVKEGVIEKTDMYNRFDPEIVIAAVEVVKGTAEIEEGADETAEHLVVGLQDSAEHVVVGHVVGDLAVCVLQQPADRISV